MEMFCMFCKEEISVSKEIIDKIYDIRKAFGNNEEMTPEEFLHTVPQHLPNCKKEGFTDKKHGLGYTQKDRNKKKELIEIHDINKKQYDISQEKQHKLTEERVQLELRLNEIKEESIIIGNESVKYQGEVQSKLYEFEQITGTKNIETWR